MRPLIAGTEGGWVGGRGSSKRNVKRVMPSLILRERELVLTVSAAREPSIPVAQETTMYQSDKVYLVNVTAAAFTSHTIWRYLFWLGPFL